MDKTSFLDDLQRRIDAVSNTLPAAEVRNNLKALLTSQFAKLDLVTREEFDTQARVLARTREKLEQLQIRLDQIEAARSR